MERRSKGLRRFLGCLLAAALCCGGGAPVAALAGDGYDGDFDLTANPVQITAPGRYRVRAAGWKRPTPFRCRCPAGR